MKDVKQAKKPSEILMKNRVNVVQIAKNFSRFTVNILLLDPYDCFLPFFSFTCGHGNHEKVHSIPVGYGNGLTEARQVSRIFQLKRVTQKIIKIKIK